MRDIKWPKRNVLPVITLIVLTLVFINRITMRSEHTYSLSPLTRQDRSVNHTFEGEKTIDRVSLGPETTTDQVNLGRETTTDRVNPGRETTIDRVSLGPETTTDQVNLGRETTTDRVNPGRETTTDRVNLGRETTTDRVNLGRETTTDRVHPGLETTTDQVNLGRETTTDQVNLGRETTLVNPERQDRGFCGDDISMFQNCTDNTCRGRCGQVNNYTNPSWFCSCDMDCHIYGDCCNDFNDVCSNRTINVDNGKSFSCKSIGPERNIFMIQSCNPSYNDRDTIQKCVSERGIDSFFPVTDQLTKIVYASYFCALCNFVENNITAWKISVRCPVHENIDTSRVHHIADKNGIVNIIRGIPRQQRGCLISKFPLNTTLNIRTCIPIFSPCLPGCNDDSIIHACKSGARDPFYYHRAGRFLNNARCVQCLYRSGDQPCDPYPQIQSQSTDDKSNFFSLSILMDVITDTNLELQVQGLSNMAGINSRVMVDGSSIRVIECPKRFTLVGNECLLSSETLLELFCRIPTTENFTENVETEITKAILEVFNIMGSYYIKANSDGFVHCQFYITLPHDTVDLEAELVFKEKLLFGFLRVTQPVNSTNSGPWCKFRTVDPNLTRANQASSEEKGETSTPPGKERAVDTDYVSSSADVCLQFGTCFQSLISFSLFFLIH